ncbi:hypothetical protein PPNK14_37710 [Pectobacterium parmentieri]
MINLVAIVDRDNTKCCPLNRTKLKHDACRMLIETTITLSDGITVIPSAY